MLCHERPLREPQYTTTTLLYQSWPAAIEAAKVQESLRSSLSCHRGFRTSRCWLWSDTIYYTYRFTLRYIWKKCGILFFLYTSKKSAHSSKKCKVGVSNLIFSFLGISAKKFFFVENYTTTRFHKIYWREKWDHLVI